MLASLIGKGFLLWSLRLAAPCPAPLPASLPAPLLAPPDTLPRPRALPPTVAPADTLVRLDACPGPGPARIGGIVFLGNAVTRERILRAELDLHPGDSLALADLPARLEANRARIFNLQLFHSVLVQASCGSAGRLTLLFIVQERLYTFPVPIFSLAERNFRAWYDRPDRWRRLDYGLHLVRLNVRGRNETLTTNLQFGFNRKFDLFYEAPGLGPRRRLGLGLGVSYYQSHTVDYNTLADRLRSVRDADGFPIQRFFASGGLRLRHTVQRLTAFDVAYHRQQISDSVAYYNPDFYLGRQQREFLDFTLVSTDNRRNTFAYPLTGAFAQLALTQRVFLDSQTPASTTLRLRYARYFDLGHGFYYAVGATAQTRLAAALGYPDRRALGYDAYLRGYDEYVIDGRHCGLLQQGLSYRILKPGILRLPLSDNPKFNLVPLVAYLNIFADAGYVAAARTSSPAQTNQLPNTMLRSAGLALHLVTYYDRVFVIEYSRNGLGQSGFFLRSNFPI